MGRKQLQTSRTTLLKVKSRLYEPITGTYYAGYLQNLFREQLAVAYIFSRKVPEYGGTLVNRLTGKLYKVKNVIPLEKGKIIDSYELVLRACP